MLELSLETRTAVAVALFALTYAGMAAGRVPWLTLDRTGIAPAGALYGLAVLSTLAGNLFLVGSIANLIVAERAQAAGVRFGFWDHARAGVPLTLVSMALACLWFYATGMMAL